MAIVSANRVDDLHDCVAAVKRCRQLDSVLVVENSDQPPDLSELEAPNVKVMWQSPGRVEARNRALLEAAEAWDAIVFLDDDQRVSEDWLIEFKTAADAFPQQVLSGPVRYELDTSAADRAVEAWWRAASEGRKPGVTDVVGTGNTLIPLQAWRRAGSPTFRAEYEAGGEDTDFFRRLHRCGTIIRVVPGPAVDEKVPAERSTRRWILQRLFINGSSRAVRRRQDGAERRIVLAHGAARVFAGIGRGALMSVVRRRIWPQDFGTLIAGLAFLAIAVSPTR